MKKRLKRIKKEKDLKAVKPSKFSLIQEAKRWIFSFLFLAFALILTLSFFELAGMGGKVLISVFSFLLGKAIYALPFAFLACGLIFFSENYRKYLFPVNLANIFLVLGVAGALRSFFEQGEKGGFIGYLVSFPFLKFFGPLVSKIVFGATVAVSFLIFVQIVNKLRKVAVSEEEEEKKSIVSKIFGKRTDEPQFKIKEIEPVASRPLAPEMQQKGREGRPTGKPALVEFTPPPFELLDQDGGKPTVGDTKLNSSIIKKTLENFGIPVEMAEINIGPTVTQYSLKPAEGVKLSKITGLSNDLALALAAHPIRIEAPIPGKSLVGVEVPNKTRSQIGLRELVNNPNFQKSFSHLNISLGRDVSGYPCYAELSKMPHLLVAGSTGSGKTIFLNNLIVSLLYQNSPQTMRMILIDPKRVEFSIYQGLPHLLCPVVHDSTRAVKALAWLIEEMERRFDFLSSEKARDIATYNKRTKDKILPYIIVVVDELADLMAAKGREMEAGVVRLAQMARAVGIHLVLATQRPSVEVITGLIKANITSRVSFQVASQIDSRTVLDTSGAEKLLGSGDMLFLSSELGKPKRIQSAYVSEKELRSIVEYVEKNEKVEEEITENHLREDLTKKLEDQDVNLEDFEGEGDPLFEEAKRLVVQAKKASASLFQRHLRIGYARAARLIDELESRGIVGPQEGSKAREVFIGGETPAETDNIENDSDKSNIEEI